MNIPAKLKSRKLWLTILGTAVAFWQPALIPFLKVLIPAYVVGQGIADAGAGIGVKAGQ